MGKNGEENVERNRNINEGKNTGKGTGQKKKAMGLWLIVQGSLFLCAIAVKCGQGISETVISCGFLLSFYLIFTYDKWMDRLKTGEFSERQEKIADYSVIFTFLLMFFLISPLFRAMGERNGWTVALLLMGIQYLVLSFLHGKSMLWLGGLVLLDAVLLFCIKNASLIWFTGGYAVLLFLFGISLAVLKKRKETGNEEVQGA